MARRLVPSASPCVFGPTTPAPLNPSPSRPLAALPRHTAGRQPQEANTPLSAHSPAQRLSRLLPHPLCLACHLEEHSITPARATPSGHPGRSSSGTSRTRNTLPLALPPADASPIWLGPTSSFSLSLPLFSPHQHILSWRILVLPTTPGLLRFSTPPCNARR